MEQQSLYNSTSFSNHGLGNVNILSTLLRPTAEKKKKEIPFKKEKKEKQLVVYKETLRLSADFSTETLQAGKDWHNIVTVRKGGGKKLPSRIFYLARLSFRLEREIEFY